MNKLKNGIGFRAVFISKLGRVEDPAVQNNSVKKTHDEMFEIECWERTECSRDQTRKCIIVDEFSTKKRANKTLFGNLSYIIDKNIMIFF